MKSNDKSSWAIGGGVLCGIGVGFFYLKTNVFFSDLGSGLYYPVGYPVLFAAVTAALAMMEIVSAIANRHKWKPSLLHERSSTFMLD